MLGTIKQMLDAFEEHHILYCHWKSNEHLLAALEGDTDLDMLFDPIQRGQLEALLNECGLKRFRALPLMQYNAIEDFIGFDKDTCKIWHLHLHYRMTLGQKHLKGYTITPFTSYILKTRVLTDNGVYTSSPEVEFILLMIRMAMKLRTRDWFKRLCENDRKESDWLIQHSSRELFEQHARGMICDDKVVSRLVSLYGIGLLKTNQLRSLRSVLLPYLKNYTGYSSVQSRWNRSIRELFWGIGGFNRRMYRNPSKPYRRVSPSGGTVVAIMGCDGAGKSTTINYLYREYRKKIDVKTIYFGSGDGSSSLVRKPLLFFAKRIGGRGFGKSVEKMKNHRTLKSRVYSVAKVIWAITLAMEKMKKLREMTKARNRGMLVITDRYPQIVVLGYNDGPLLAKYLESNNSFFRRIAQWEYKIYERSTFNPPDLLIKLVVPTDIAIRRKPEMTVEEIEKKKAAVRAVNVSRSVEVDTSVNLKRSLGEIMSCIWEVI